MASEVTEDKVKCHYFRKDNCTAKVSKIFFLEFYLNLELDCILFYDLVYDKYRQIRHVNNN